MRRIVGLCFMLIALGAGTALAQVSVGETGTIKGKVFGDFYWIPLNHNADLKGNNGFWFRRIYFTYEREISDSFSSRFRLEMNSEGDFATNAKLVPVVKDAYLKWSNEKHSIYAGISSSPTWGLVEDVWGYRSVEKTPLDLQKFGSSRDFGVKIKGKLGNDGKIGYNFMVGNGNSNRSELNEGKKIMLALSYELSEHWIIEAYGDFNGQPDNSNIVTGQGFLAYQSEFLNLGVLYAHQFRNKALIAGDLNLDLASVFANFSTSKNTKGFLRVDHLFDPNPDGGDIDYIPFSDLAESTLIIGGIDIKLDSKVHLMPNIETVIYGESAFGSTPDPDLIPRLTLLYNF